jgi:acylphosphatase
MKLRAIRHVVIRGGVQGVGYRMWAQDIALEHGLEGWVRNRHDGSVEAVFAGPAESVEQIVAKCRDGPPAACVSVVEEREGSPADLASRRSGERFSLLPTL